MACRRLRAVAQHLAPAPSPCAGGGSASAPSSALSSPWSDDDGCILAAWTHGSQEVSAHPDRRKTFNVLSEEDHAFFEREGYVLIHAAVPAANIERVKRETWQFLGMDEAEPESWYREGHGGMVQCYQSQGQWDNRAYPRVHGAFADLFGTPELWTSFDMLHMKPPSRPRGEGDPGFVHWDLGMPHLRQGMHLRLQGELLLEDMPAGGGGFQCIPGYHLAAADWAAAQPEDAGGAVPDMDDPAMAGYELKHVEGRAGDLLICACATPPRIRQAWS